MPSALQDAGTVPEIAIPHLALSLREVRSIALVGFRFFAGCAPHTGIVRRSHTNVTMSALWGHARAPVSVWCNNSSYLLLGGPGAWGSCGGGGRDFV
ncbi:uncharacterized protein FIBRA_08213 [Fibroporia radiculosa]|uniref:Uncharacterized protein n=1 Tax=Fibroporia radiculosa TaxID=599839 RepID=J4I2D4_9APHY|nr:uncharacterized protein FIBRA_08213 [Fibroporia radiculosa]CCM05972.1 predicted protein [Fibroporia radiculosa]